MTEYPINSFNDFHNLIDHKSFKTLYRGQGNVSWDLLPKAGRPDYTNMTEKSTLTFFKKSALPYLKMIPHNDLEWLTLAQHNGIPTRLLDWTTNPLIAAFFAVEEEHNTDAVIYRYKFKQEADVETLEPFTIDKVFVIKPFASSDRVIRQRGYFTIHPKPTIQFKTVSQNEQLDKLIIKKNYKSKLRAELRTYGVTQFEIFGEIEGLSKYMNWRSRHFQDFT